MIVFETFWNWIYLVFPSSSQFSILKAYFLWKNFLWFTFFTTFFGFLLIWLLSNPSTASELQTMHDGVFVFIWLWRSFELLMSRKAWFGSQIFQTDSLISLLIDVLLRPQWELPASRNYQSTGISHDLVIKAVRGGRKFLIFLSTALCWL